MLILATYQLCDIIDEDDAISSSVVACGNGLEPLLSCCVPLYRNGTGNKTPIKAPGVIVGGGGGGE